MNFQAIGLVDRIGGAALQNQSDLVLVVKDSVLAYGVWIGVATLAITALWLVIGTQLSCRK